MRQFITYKTLAIILLLFVFASCEKVIELNLNKTEDQMVVDAVISNFPNQSVIRLSMSNPIFSDQAYNLVNNANVIVSNDEGELFSFLESEPGIYKSENFRGNEGSEYQLKIDWENINVSASSIMPKKISIDSIELVISERGFMGNDEIAYSLKIHFTDPPEVDNYYRFEVFNSDSLYEGFIVSNDLFYDGISTYQFVMGLEIKPSDTISVELSSIDEANYSYFLVLSQSGSPFNIAPGNPVSNIQGNAIGYFGAYAQDRKYIVIPPVEYIAAGSELSTKIIY